MAEVHRVEGPAEDADPSMAELEQVLRGKSPGGALVDPDAAPLVLYSPGVSGIRFWWGGPLEKGASTVGEVPDR